MLKLEQIKTILENKSIVIYVLRNICQELNDSEYN